MVGVRLVAERRDLAIAVPTIQRLRLVQGAVGLEAQDPRHRVGACASSTARSRAPSPAPRIAGATHIRLMSPMIFAIILIGATNLATDYTRGATIRRRIDRWQRPESSHRSGVLRGP